MGVYNAEFQCCMARFEVQTNGPDLSSSGSSLAKPDNDSDGYFLMKLRQEDIYG